MPTLTFVAVVVGCAVLAGLTVITGTVLLVDTLRASNSSESFDLRFYLLAIGTLSGLLLAGFGAWHLLGNIHSTYRRGGLAIVCAFATVLLMLICMPVNQFFGRTGLILLLGLSGLGSALMARRARTLRTRT